MRKKFGPPISRLMLTLALISGCSIQRERFEFFDSDVCHVPTDVINCGPSQIRLANAEIANDCGTGTPEGFSPYDLDESKLAAGNLLPMSLNDCIQLTLSNSKVLRDLGGTVLTTPQIVTSTLDPALVFSDPRSGEEAALSAFDANFFANSYFEENNRRSNNQFLGDNGFFTQYLNTSQIGVSKTSATGGLFSLRNVTIGDNNNQASNRLGNQSWESFFEAEMRQPLRQGGGTEFNRIAGPGAAPGQLNGVLLARTRTDQSLIEFERATRDLVAEVENAYWDLYFAYRDLEAKIEVRNIAQKTLDKIRDDDGAAKKAQAEEQVHRFQADVVDALNGRPIDGTRTNNGSAGGSFRGVGGVRVAERRLRLLIGIPINDGRLLQTIDSPAEAPVMYDWDSSIAEAIRGREELKRQRWIIKQRELELLANRNFLLPQLDMVARYRYRGFGDSLLGDASGIPAESFFDGELQEWALGLEYNAPLGFRRAHAAVRNSQLALVRETEILREQERFVHYGLSNAVSESKRAFESMDLQRLRLVAIVAQLDALKEKEESAEETPELDVVLETHRRLLDARLRFHQSQVEYALSLRNVHFEKGTLLQYNNVYLAESIVPTKAQQDAAERIEHQDATVQPAVRDVILAN
jgi:outer membrane protein TolC